MSSGTELDSDGSAAAVLPPIGKARSHVSAGRLVNARPEELIRHSIGSSACADLACSDAYDGMPALLENGLKVGGIRAWTAYHTAAACCFLRGEAIGADRLGELPSSAPLDVLDRTVAAPE